MKSFSFYSLLLILTFSLAACKSTEVATDGANDGMTAAEETAMDVADKVMDVAPEGFAVNELLEKHFAARGGKDKIKAIQSMKWTAGMEMMGMNMPLTVQMKRPNKMRQDVDVQAMNAKVTSAFDGTTAWMINPMGGSSEAQKMPEDAAQQMKEQGSMDGAVMGYMEKGYEMTYDGEEMVNDKPAHKVMVQLPEDKSVTVFFDAESFLEVKTVQEGTNPMTGATGTMATFSSDYREVGGVMMAHKISAEFDGQPLQTFQIDVIEVNQDIPNSVFEMPGMSGSMN